MARRPHGGKLDWTNWIFILYICRYCSWPHSPEVIETPCGPFNGVTAPDGHAICAVDRKLYLLHLALATKSSTSMIRRHINVKRSVEMYGTAFKTCNVAKMNFDMFPGTSSLFGWTRVLSFGRTLVGTEPDALWAWFIVLWRTLSVLVVFCWRQYGKSYQTWSRRAELDCSMLASAQCIWLDKW